MTDHEAPVSGATPRADGDLGYRGATVASGARGPGSGSGAPPGADAANARYQQLFA